mmetsp:Transcript_13476/g.32960  ORF Transcript_13476/g.32960 Transcript_13476/m.32960 type:complete len:448 (-) Transcript_13476:215-1558(-)
MAQHRATRSGRAPDWIRGKQYTRQTTSSASAPHQSPSEGKRHGGVLFDASRPLPLLRPPPPSPVHGVIGDGGEAAVREACVGACVLARAQYLLRLGELSLRGGLVPEGRGLEEPALRVEYPHGVARGAPHDGGGDDGGDAPQGVVGRAEPVVRGRSPDAQGAEGGGGTAGGPRDLLGGEDEAGLVALHVAHDPVVLLAFDHHVEVEEREERDLELVELAQRDLPDAAPQLARVEDVVVDLGGEHEGREEHALRVGVRQLVVGVLPLYPQHVDQPDDDVARRRLRVPADPHHVPFGGAAQRVPLEERRSPVLYVRPTPPGRGVQRRGDAEDGVLDHVVLHLGVVRAGDLVQHEGLPPLLHSLRVRPAILPRLIRASFVLAGGARRDGVPALPGRVPRQAACSCRWGPALALEGGEDDREGSSNQRSPLFQILGPPGRVGGRWPGRGGR